LTPDRLEPSVPPVLTSRSTIRVRYAETDMMGIVYHGAYLPWLEVARTDMFRQLGLSYRDLESSGYRLPVLGVNCRYLQPAVYDDEVEIEVTLKERPTLRIRLDYTLRKGSTLLAEASTEHAFVDQSGRPTRPPSMFAEVMQTHFAD
jgi:acyl-CoA thioester hydrolase